jgi:hypothetical protein
MRRLSHGRRRILLVCHALDTRMGAYSFLGNGVVDTRRELDCYLIHQLFWWPVDTKCYYAVERGLCAESVADGTCVLGSHVDMHEC